jgi:hypothetical protein
MKNKQFSHADQQNGDGVSDNRCKQLCTCYHQLSEIYTKCENLAKAETCARKAYVDRLQVLGSADQRTHNSERQLFRILGSLPDVEKVLEAEKIYYNNWCQLRLDEYALDNGYELGCLHQERGSLPEAATEFRRVWEQRKEQGSPQEEVMTTITALLSVLKADKKDDDRLVILEDLWNQNAGRPLTPWMLRNADTLASLCVQNAMD